MTSIEFYTDILITDFKLQYGEEKFQKVRKKIQESKKLDRFLTRCNREGIVPLENDYFYLLHEIPFFLFRKADIVEIGAVLALWKWHNSFNKNYECIDELGMLEILKGIEKASDKLRFRKKYRHY